MSETGRIISLKLLEKAAGLDRIDATQDHLGPTSPQQFGPLLGGDLEPRPGHKLTDEKWREMLDAGSAPDQPKWCEGYWSE